MCCRNRILDAIGHRENKKMVYQTWGGEPKSKSDVLGPEKKIGQTPNGNQKCEPKQLRKKET